VAEELSVGVGFGFGERNAASDPQRAAAYVDRPGVRSYCSEEADLDIDLPSCSRGCS
jgi:hypothetical protein